MTHLTQPQGLLRQALGLLYVWMLWAFAFASSAHAGVLNYCDKPREPSAAELSLSLQFSDLVRSRLNSSGHDVALTSFAGLDLGLLDIRYSHMGFALKNNPQSSWAVRQLYFDCDLQHARLFDQGLAGFLTGKATGDEMFVSLVFIPTEAAPAIERTVLDNRTALALLNPDYSANAYPYSTLYQNCNQWVVEMLAASWGALSGQDAPPAANPRTDAQRWLQSRAYTPTLVPTHHPLVMWATGQFKWLHRDDHPAQDQQRLVYQVSLPAAVETFVHDTLPQAERLEFCLKGQQVVIHKGWKPIGKRCEASEGDETVMLNAPTTR